MGHGNSGGVTNSWGERQAESRLRAAPSSGVGFEEGPSAWTVLVVDMAGNGENVYIARA